MPLMDVIGPPGLGTQRTSTPRRVFKASDRGYLPGGMIIDGAKARDAGNTGNVDVLRAGQIMGKVTSGGKAAPSILGVTTNLEPAGSTSIQASAAVVTELVRRIGSSGTFKLTGPPSAGGVVVTETVTFSAASSTNITVTAITNTFIAGSFIQPTDGSETPLSFIDDGFPVIKVTDIDGASISSVDWPRVPIAGVVDSSQLLTGDGAWPTDTSLIAWLVARLNGSGNAQFVFDHAYGF